MDANKGTEKKVTIQEFFEKFSIEEIQKTTKISFNSLQKLKTGEHLSMPRVKFYGFIRILEKYYPEVDFSPLIESYETANPKKDDMPINTSPVSEEEENGGGRWWIWGIVALLIAGGYFLFQRAEKSKKITEEPEESKVVNFEYNASQFVPKPVIEGNFSRKEENGSLGEEVNLTKEQNGSLQSPGAGEENGTLSTQKEENGTTATSSTPLPPQELILYPKKRVWVKIKNSDTGKVIKMGTLSPDTPYRLKIGEKNISIRTGNEFFVLQFGEKNYTKFPEGVNKIKIVNGELIINGKKVKK